VGVELTTLRPFKRPSFPRLLLASSDLQQSGKRSVRVSGTASRHVCRIPMGLISGHINKSRSVGMISLGWGVISGWESAAWLAGLSVAVSR
jgi:hypothetical protein